MAAESISALAGLFGRPYPHWDVYPTWELEEAWRELLSAQHHDNDECEGLCGHIGKHSYERSLSITGHILQRSMRLLARRVGGATNRTVVFNPLGWVRDAVIKDPQTDTYSRVKAIPPFGYRVLPDADHEAALPDIEVTQDAQNIQLTRGTLAVMIDRKRGLVTQITSQDFPDGVLQAPLGRLEMLRKGKREQFSDAQVTVSQNAALPEVHIQRFGKDNAKLTMVVSLCPTMDAVDIRYVSEKLPRPDALMHASLQTSVSVNIPDHKLIHDHPYGLSEIRAEGQYLKKYPSGEWMTSEQYFEDIRNPFTALQLLDFDNGECGLLYLHDGSQAFFRDGETVQNILSMYDAWDEDYFVDTLDARFCLVPHGKITNTQRWMLAQEFTRPVLVEHTESEPGELPTLFGSPAWCDVPNVAVSAFFPRNGRTHGDYLEDYAGKGMEFPYIVRLAEFDGEQSKITLRVPGDGRGGVSHQCLG